MRPYKRPADYLFSTYKQTSKMRPGGAFFFSEARDALHPVACESWTKTSASKGERNFPFKN